MKNLYRTFAIAISIFMAVLVTNVAIANDSHHIVAVEQSQTANENKLSQLHLAIPSSSTVENTQDKLYKGKLTGFNSKTLTISVGEDTKEFSLSDVKQVKFEEEENIFLPNPDGEFTTTPFRGVTKNINLPLTALTFGDSTDSATLNLESMTSEGLKRLSDDIDLSQPSTLKSISFRPNERMNVKIEAKIESP